MSRRISSETYRAADDSFLLADVLETQHYDDVVEIGVGEGFVTATLASNCKNVVGTDIDTNAIEKTRERLAREGLADRVSLILCDSVSPLHGKFDSCVFNPPYLPSDIDDIALAGGKEGIETTAKWFDECVELLKPDGSVIFVASSLSNLSRLLEHVKSKGFYVNILARKRFFFEEILVIQAKNGKSHAN